MQAVSFIVLDQHSNPISGVAAILYDHLGVLVTSGTTDEDGAADFVLPSSADPGILYYARFYKAKVSFANKFGFYVINGDDVEYQIDCTTLSLNPSIKPDWCNIQGEIRTPNSQPLTYGLRITCGENAGVSDGALLFPTLTVVSDKTGFAEVELLRDTWYLVSNLPLENNRWCHVADASFMKLIDFIYPTVASISLEDDAPDNFDKGKRLTLDLTAVRTDEVSIPDTVEGWYLDQYVDVSTSNETLATAEISRNTLNIDGLDAGTVTIHIKHKKDRVHGPLSRLPYDDTDILSFEVTING